MRNSRTTSFALTLAAMLAAGGAVAQLPTTIDFESPAFSVGDLDAQGGWDVEAGAANVTTGPNPNPESTVGGAQYVKQPGDSTTPSQINKDINGAGSSRVLFSGWYYGTGSAALAAPDPTTGIAVLLGFEEINAGTTFGIRKYEGGDFVAPNPEQPLSATAWHNVVVNIRYSGTGQKTYDVKVDGNPVFANVPFVDDTVAQLNGFRSYSSASASIDLLRFEPSNAGNFDGDSLTDDQEMLQAGRDPFVADDPAAPAEIAVSHPGGAITDGQATAIGFGTVDQGDPAPTVVFTVSNTGDEELTTSAFNLTGAGFSVTEPLAASIPGGNSDTFTVALSTATAGTFNGTVSFANNDSDENPFNFPITGTVNSGEVGPGTGFLGDTNHDLVVNTQDSLATRNNFFDDYTCLADPPKCRGIGDGNNDQVVNTQDFLAVRNNFFNEYTGDYCFVTEACPADQEAGDDAADSAAKAAVGPLGTTPSISVTPASQNAGPGEQFTIEIRLDTGGSNIIGGSTRLIFDPVTVNVVSATMNTAAFNDPNATFTQITDNNVDTGRINFSGLAQAEFAGDDVLFATVVLSTEAGASGSLALDLSNNTAQTQLFSNSGTLAGLAINDGSVDIVAPSPTIVVSPASQSAGQGSQFTVEIRVDSNGLNMIGGSTRLIFDPVALDVVSATMNTTAFNDPNATFTQITDNNVDTGRINFSGLAQAEFVAADTLFATVVLSVEGDAAEGQSNLDLSDNTAQTQLFSNSGTLAGLLISDGSVTITAVQNNNPTVAIVDPAADQTVTNATNSLNISGTAADSDGTVASVVYTVNGGSEQTATGTDSWSFTASGLNVGANTISVQSVDNLGARSTAATRTITRNPLPTVAITTPASDQTVPNATTSFNFAGTAADANGTIASVSYTVNGGSVQAATGTANWTFTVNGLVEGANVVSVTATDNTGDVSAPVVRTITRSAPNQAPTVVITTPATDLTVSNGTTFLAFAGTANDPAKAVVSVLYSINGGEENEADGSTEWEFTAGLAVGENVISVVAVDNEGTRSVPATRTICRSVGPLFNGDDLMVLTEFTDVWYAALEQCGFATPERMLFTGFHHDIANDHVSLFGDLTNDGLIDVLTITNGGEFGPEVWTATNQGGGLLGPSVKNSAGWGVDKDPAVRQFLGADFNGDGMMDLLQVENNSLTFAINTLGTIGAPTTIAAPGLIVNADVHLATGDFNGDGADDILHLDNTAGTVAAVFGSATPPGSGSLAPVVLLVTSPFRYDPANQQAIVVGDYNGDGNDDVAFVQDGTPNVSVALMNIGGNALGAPTTWAAQLGFHVDPSRDTGWWVFSTDLDGDGDEDLVQQTGFQTVWASYSNGSTAFGNPSPIAGLGYEHKPEGLWQIFPGKAID